MAANVKLGGTFAPAPSSNSTSQQTQQAFQVDEDFSVQQLAENENYMNKVRGYMTDRYTDGVQAQDESNEDYVERFLTNMRSFENRSLELGGQIDYLRQADEGQRKQFLDAYTIYNKLPGFMSKGGGSALSAVGDYAYYNVVDPVNLAGLGVGSIVAKQLAKQGVKGLMKGLASYGTNFLAEGALGAGMDVGLQKVEKEAGIRDEYDFGRTAKAGLLSGAGSVALQGAASGIAKGYNKYGEGLNIKRSLSSELDAANKTDATDNNVQAAKRSIDEPVGDSGFDYTRGKELLDEIGGNVKNPDLIEPEVKIQISKVITEVAEGLFRDPDMKIQRAEGEQISDALFRLFKNEKAIETIDADALSGALSKAGVSADQFAAIYRTTVSDAGKQLNALSQLAKKLKEVGGLDIQANSRVKEYFDQKPTGTSGKLYDGMLWLDRQRRALLVSSFQTTLRNAATTGIRGPLDTAANILDATAFYGVRQAQKLAGKDVPEYTIGDAFSDGFGMMRNLADQDYAKDVVNATLGSNPKLMTQISRSLTDVGDGSLATVPRLANFMNMAHDAVVRRAIYSASLEKQLRRVTGKSIAETLADGAEIPKEIVQEAVRESLEFTFANMPTGKLGNGFVKAVEALPFIGTGVITFPRFTVAAMNFTIDYVAGGHLVRGGKNLIGSIATGNTRQFDKASSQLSKGLVGSYFLFEAIEHRRKNQDVKWFEYKTNDKRTNDLRPFFPLAPYLLIADVIVKLGEGTMDRVAQGEIIEGLLGTRLAGSAMYTIDGFYQALGSEGSGGADGITGQRVAEAVGGFLGELTGGPVSTNLASSLVRDIARSFDTEEARMRDTRQSDSNTASERFMDAFINSALRNVPYANQDKPALQSPTRESDMFYQSPFTTTVTGIRSQQERNPLEAEMVRLGITNYDINPSTGSKSGNAAVAEGMGMLADTGMIDVTSDSYDAMSDAEKKNYIFDRMQDTRSVAKDMSLGSDQERRQFVTDQNGIERSYTPMDKANWGKTPARVRAQIQEEFKADNNGQTVEEAGAYVEAVATSKSVSGRYK